ncbi:MAG: peptidoglycan DD-metalloendopeptidase family protein [Bacteroidia bacterium]|nr:peptidoglycan DD-metalloendopeptidase family protein [Bacteroidia bacterium]MCF8425561.1 peptidoglycan DD-metalloendopeptidase family protein [Bacteroidia bacterium]MCF8447475.1 peptidoglycan DD-metalloendopeptidase family protein [Bacteroidia bacterium]
MVVKRIVVVSIYFLLFFSFNSKTFAQVTDSTEVSDEKEEEEEESEAAEYDSVIVSSSDRYWDYIRPKDFLFDTAFAPANMFYSSWDTITINPYKKDLKNMEDTIRLVLANYDDCSFHPPAIGDITSNFGFRNWGRRQKFHFGTDIRMEVGDPVYAAFEGVVRIAKKSSDYGYVVLIRHNNGLETLYAHFSQLLAYPGQPVKGGNIIGLAGSTGRSTGPHLHFEVRFQGEKIDPATIIHFPSGSLLNDTFQVDKGCFKHLYDVQAAKLKAKAPKVPKYVKARKGDTIAIIARRYRISATRVSKLNGIKVNTKLKTGRTIRLR